MCGYFIHCYAAIFLHDGFNCCNGLWCHDQAQESVTERMPFMNFLVHSYTDIHHYAELSFVDEFRLVSPLHYAVLLWCMLQAGPPSLHYYCSVVLHSCNLLPPVGHSSNHEYHCCQLTRQSSCVSNFYRTKVFHLTLPRRKVSESFKVS
jgi:hypothetical protein